MSAHTRSILADAAHRPWPLPRSPWVMYQSWRRLLFAHWRVAPEALRPLVPGELALDTFGDAAWVAITPFAMADVRPRGVPALPRLSRFPEMNLRTYVRVGDRSGIFFFSLDAGSRLAAAGGRALYRLPYHHAEMAQETRRGWIHYRSRRADGADAEFVGRYRPQGERFEAAPGSLEHFLTERYALYTVLPGGRVLRAEIHHGPWALRAAEAVVERNTLFVAHGIDASSDRPLLHYAERQDTLVWPLASDRPAGPPHETRRALQSRLVR